MNTQLNKDPARIQQMFNQVAPKYDSANSILSLGLHHFWRKRLVQLAQPGPKDNILDAATGTGDLAIALRKAAGPEASVTGIDFSEKMLALAPKKSEGMSISYKVADILQLPFADATFQLVTIAFGIRNVAHLENGLRELGRVLAPGGRLAILEFGQIETPGLASLYNFYSKKVLPRVGGWVTGQSAAYDYLQKSSSEFPAGRKFESVLRKVGFSKVQVHSLSFGICFIYIARK